MNPGFLLRSRVNDLPPSDGLPHGIRRWAILATALGVSLSVIDGTIANVALPTLAADLGTSPSRVIWVVNAYQLAIVVTMLAFSSLGDLRGYRRIYLSGIALFTVTSLVCALSTSLAMLTAARILQGFGASAITSVNTALLRIIYPRAKIGRGMGLNALVVAVSIAAGPTLAAGILSVASWHYLFAVNVPIGIAALVLGRRYLPTNRQRPHGRRFDRIGALCNAASFGLLVLTLEGLTHGQPAGLVAAAALAFGAITTLYVRSQRRKDAPLLPVDLMRIPIFSLSIVNSICSFTAQMLAMISLPFFFAQMGRSAVDMGLLLTPWPLATMIAAPLAGRLVERFHPGVLGSVGMALFALGLALMATLPEHPTVGAVVWRMMVCGAGFGLFQTPNNSTIISSAPPERSGAANGMLSTARLLGQTMGATLAAMLFRLLPVEGMRWSLWLGGGFAVAAAIISVVRIAQPAPIRRSAER